MDDDQTCPESVLLVAMERAFRGPEYAGTQTRDWQPHMKRVLQCVRENDPMVIEVQKEIERLRNRAYDLDNELAAGVHTCGPTCRKTPVCAERADLREENERLCAQVDALQARMDALMLEFCPDEMTKTQLENWARHQRPASDEVQAAYQAARSE
jgi:hypothetical protein